MDTSIRVTTEAHDDAVIVVLAGELDGSGALGLEAEGIDTSRVDAIDARYVTFIDAAGIRALLSMAGHEPVAVLASPAVRRVVELCDLGDHLRIDTPAPAAGLCEAQFGLLEVDGTDWVVTANRRIADVLGVDVASLRHARLTDLEVGRDLRHAVAEVRRWGGPVGAELGGAERDREPVSCTLWRHRTSAAAPRNSVVLLTDPRAERPTPRRRVRGV